MYLSQEAEGVKLTDGSRLKYRLNGHLAFWVSLLVMGHGFPSITKVPRLGQPNFGFFFFFCPPLLLFAPLYYLSLFLALRARLPLTFFYALLPLAET